VLCDAVSSFVELVPIILSQPGIKVKNFTKTHWKNYLVAYASKGRQMITRCSMKYSKGLKHYVLLVTYKAIAGNFREKKRSADQPVVGNSQLQKIINITKKRSNIKIILILMI